MKTLLFLAAMAAPNPEALVPCDAIFTTPVPAWVCAMETPRPDTPPDAAMQAEIDAAWERFLSEADEAKPGQTGQ